MRTMSKTILQNLIESGVVSYDLVDSLRTQFDEEEILMYIMFNVYGYGPKSICDLLNKQDEKQVKICLCQIEEFVSTSDLFETSSSLLGWADSTRFKN